MIESCTKWGCHCDKHSNDISSSTTGRLLQLEAIYAMKLLCVIRPILNISNYHRGLLGMVLYECHFFHAKTALIGKWFPMWTFIAKCVTFCLPLLSLVTEIGTRDLPNTMFYFNPVLKTKRSAIIQLCSNLKVDDHER
jgi:hypothetical protein